MAILARTRTHDMRHQKSNLGWREEFAGALSRTFCEFAKQIFVSAAEKVRLNVRKPEAVARIGECLNHSAQFRGINVALAITLSGKIHHVDNTGKRRVLLND